MVVEYNRAPICSGLRSSLEPGVYWTTQLSHHQRTSALKVPHSPMGPLAAAQVRE